MGKWFGVDVSSYSTSRPGIFANRVPLIVILISDADDYSCSANCDNNEMEHNPNARNFPTDRYINFLQQVKGNENSQALFFPITPLDNFRCPVEDPGIRYMNVQRAMGGGSVSGSICDADMDQSFLNIANIIANRGTVFPLSSAAKGKAIALYVDGNLVPNTPDNYTYDSAQNAIIFTGSAPNKGSTIQVTYSQGKG